MFLFAYSSMHKSSFFLSWLPGYHIMVHLMHKWKPLKLLSMVKLKLWIFGTECNLQQKLKNWEFEWLWKRWGRRVFVESRTFKYEGERNNHMLHYEQVFGNVFERRESECCEVLMKHCRKVKAEQVITLQMAQQLKTKTINVVPGQLFCR